MPRLNRKKRIYGMGDNLITLFPEPIIAQRAPTTSDFGEVGSIWIDTTANDAFFLTSASGTATWINAGGGSGTFASVTTTGAITAGTTLTVGTTVTFSAMTRGVLVADNSGIVSSINGTDGQLVIGATGADPIWASVVSGDGSVVIAVGANSLDLRVSGAAASTFPTDAGTATPAAGATTIAGGTNVNTAGAGATVTINVDNAPTFSGLLTGSAGLTISAGTTTITSDTNAAQAIYLHADGGVNETIEFHSDQGTSVNSVNILSDLGGITFQAVGLASDDAINLEADAGGIDMDAAMQINIASSEAAADAIRINSSNAAGGLDVDDGGGGMTFDSLGAISFDGAAASNFTVTGAGIDLTLSSAAGRVIVQGDEATANAVTIASTGGGIDADCVGQMNLDSSQAAANAIRINTSDGAGGMDLDAGTGGIAVDTTGAISLDAAAASNFTATGAFDVTISSTLGSVLVDGGEAVADAINIDASNGAGGIDMDAGTGGVAIDTTGAISLDSTAASNFTATGAFDVTISSTAGSILIDGGEAVADAINIDASDAAGGVDIDAGTGGIALDSTGAVSLDGAAASNFSVSGAGIDLTLASAAGRVIVNGEEAAANAITLLSAAGGLDVDCALQINIDSSQAAANAILIDSSNAAGGIDVDAGTGGIAVDTTGAISLDSTAASNFTATGAFDLTLSSTAGSVLIDGGEAVADAINIDASDAGGGIDVDSGTGGIAIDSTGAISLDGAAASNFNVTGAGIDLTLGSAAGRIIVDAGEDAAQAIYLHADAGISETIDIHADQGTGDTSVNIHSDGGGVTIDGSSGNIKLTPGTNSVAGVAITLNKKVGVLTFTGQTTAAAAQEAFTITNSEVAATSGILLTVANVGANDARMTLEQVKPAAGSFVVNTQNNGAAALNGDVIMSFIVLN